MFDSAMFDSKPMIYEVREDLPFNDYFAFKASKDIEGTTILAGDVLIVGKTEDPKQYLDFPILLASVWNTYTIIKTSELELDEFSKSFVIGVVVELKRDIENLLLQRKDN